LSYRSLASQAEELPAGTNIQTLAGDLHSDEAGGSPEELGGGNDEEQDAAVTSAMKAGDATKAPSVG